MERKQQELLTILGQHIFNPISDFLVRKSSDNLVLTATQRDLVFRYSFVPVTLSDTMYGQCK